MVTISIVAVTVPAIDIVNFSIFEQGDSVSKEPRNEIRTVQARQEDLCKIWNDFITNIVTMDPDEE